MAQNNLTHCKACGEKKLTYGKKRICPICNLEELKEMSERALKRNEKVINGMIKERR